MSIIKGKTSVQEAARKHGITIGKIEKWIELAMESAKHQLRSRPREEDALEDERIKQHKRKFGQLTLELEILKEAVRPCRPTEGRTSAESRFAETLDSEVALSSVAARRLAARPILSSRALREAATRGRVVEAGGIEPPSEGPRP